MDLRDTTSDRQTAHPGGKTGNHRWRAVATAILLAFMLGALLALYLVGGTGWRLPGGGEEAGSAAQAAALREYDAELGAATSASRIAQVPPTMALRVEELERRLNRIDLQAEAASGNAARAEGLLIAFAARRLLERGAPLGYLENQLRLRFGNAQPNAVSTIVNSARDPVTLEELREDLADLRTRALELPEEHSGWDRVQAELAQLFVLRRTDAPSPQPEQRLNRAEALLENGRVEPAAALIARLPNRAATADWLADARRYEATNEALNLIEMAALLEPRSLIDGNGQAVRQRSPAAPAPAPAQAQPEAEPRPTTNATRAAAPSPATTR